MSKDIEHRIFFHIWNGHFKLWGYESYVDDEDKHRVSIFWGSLNNVIDSLKRKVKPGLVIAPQSSQVQEKRFHHSTGYSSFTWDKVEEKIAKGYREIPVKIWQDYISGVVCITELLYNIEKRKELGHGR